MVDASPEAPLARTPENYRELQAMIHYADPLFIGRNGAWIGSQAVLLAIAVAQFDRVPTAMVLTLAVTGVIISLFWLLIAKSTGGRVDIESFYLFAKILLDRLADAFGPYFGVSLKTRGSTYVKLAKGFPEVVAAKELVEPGGSRTHAALAEQFEQLRRDIIEHRNVAVEH